MIDENAEEPPFRIDLAENVGTVTVTVSGELDITTVGALEQTTDQLRPHDRLLLDLRGVTFMDSSGVRLIMALDVRARAEGWTFVLVRGPGPVKHVLDLCLIADRVPTVSDPAHAPDAA